MKLSMNVTTTFHNSTLGDIAVAKAAGYDGIELQSWKLYRYLDAGLPVSGLLEALGGLTVSGVGALQEAPPEEFAREARRLAEVTAALGATDMQMCTGPVDWTVVQDHRAGRLAAADARYCGAVRGTEQDALDLTGRNLATAADIAAEHGLNVYLEPLGWAPVNSIKQAVRIFDTIQRPNVKLTVDFWHCFVAGDTPEDVAALDPSLIAAAHVCDGLGIEPGVVPDQSLHRNVCTGGGVLPIQEYVDAVKSTGFDGWYCSEIFCDKVADLDHQLVATTMRGLMEIFVS